MEESHPVLAAFGAELRRFRENAELTQAALADAAGISRRTLVAIEAGQANPTLLKLLSIARALDLTPGQLTDTLLSVEHPAS
jgi:transcriptional regulator with XRE-family HTH domain